MLHQLINEDCLKKQYNEKSARKSLIIITIINKIEIKRLLANGLYFEEAIKKIKKYQEAELESVFIKCCKISHKCWSTCRNMREKYVIYIKAHLATKQKCGVNECNKEQGKLYIYVIT